MKNSENLEIDFFCVFQILVSRRSRDNLKTEVRTGYEIWDFLKRPKKCDDDSGICADIIRAKYRLNK